MEKIERKEAFTIAIEGSDGAGKETQSKLLKERLLRQGFSVGSVSFPLYKQTAAGWALFEALKGDNKDAYKFVNVDPKAASLLYAADRRESLPYLQSLINENNIVIFDRYVESNLLHQGGKFKTNHGKEEFARWLFNLEYGMLALPSPKVIVYLELPFEVSLARAKKRAEESGGQLDAVERDVGYVRNGHEAGIFYAKKFGWLRIPCATSDGYELTPDEVHELIVKNLEKRGYET
jgi:dTMP kinase